MRFIFDVRLREHISPYLYSLHILPVSYRVKFKASTIAYKLVNGNAPSYLMEKAPLFKPTSDKPVRQGSGRDHLMFDSNLAMQKSSMWIAKMIIEWNKLPFDLRCLQDLDVFKSKLKTHYFKQAFKQFWLSVCLIVYQVLFLWFFLWFSFSFVSKLPYCVKSNVGRRCSVYV